MRGKGEGRQDFYVLRKREECGFYLKKNKLE